MANSETGREEATPAKGDFGTSTDFFAENSGMGKGGNSVPLNPKSMGSKGKPPLADDIADSQIVSGGNLRQKAARKNISGVS